MDCKDLMVGDWVRFKENYPQKELQGKIAKVKGVRGRIDVRTQDGEYYESEHPDWLEPIPITKEILEKNSLQKLNDKTFLIKNQIEIEVGTKFSEISARYEDYDRDYNSYNNRYIEIAIIHYVHELQHLLRLCGIEKELTI